MARKNLENKNIRGLAKGSGGASYGITIPREYIRKLKWRSKQKLEVTLYRDRLIVRDWKPGPDRAGK